jgi:glutamate-1-semialdehyde 2,1-aminomutase
MSKISVPTAAAGRETLSCPVAESLRERAHALIPGGCHTYAKGDDQYPAIAPPFIVRGSGCHVWDVSGRHYIEYAMGLRSVTLGHGYAPVVEAAVRQMRDGTNFNRPSPIEGDCAEMFLSMVPSAEMVKFTKDGSTCTTAAVKLARAYTGRECVAICADSPFYSYDDWFIGTTAMDGGIPEIATAHTLRFQYNRIETLEALFDARPNRIACVMLEPARSVEPAGGFLQQVRALCRRHGAVLVFDETITGFRWHAGGAQDLYGVAADLSVFGKAMGNGFAISALAGRRDLMDQGGIRTPGARRVFLLSTTHGAENHALAAAMATMKVYRDEPVIEHLHAQGERLRAGVEPIVAALGLGANFGIEGRGCALMFSCRDREGAPSQPMRTLFLQEMIRRGVLAPSWLTAYTHDDRDIDRTIEACGEALEIYRKALDEGCEPHLIGPPTRGVYRRYN